MDLSSFKFNPRIAEGIRRQGYTEATPIQEKAIPHVLEGNDVLCLAQTGTGKTAVFVLPILEHLLKKRPGPVRALILSPTRELAEQTREFFTALGSATPLGFTSIYGGTNINKQINRLKNGVEVVVACPGRLLDHMNRGTIDLSEVEILVIDEADRMLDMGFIPDVRKIVKKVPRDRQTLLFSATMPDDVRQLAQEVLWDPVTVEVAHSKPAHTVAHAIYPVEHYLKTSLLKEILKMTDTGSVLVFTRTKHRARRVGNQLSRSGYDAASLHGDMGQGARQDTLKKFKSGKIQILVATDIAARGIDISTISHVINYDIPDTPDNYIHRIGRTGRAERTGDAFTFVSHEDERTVRAIEGVLGEEIERRFMDKFDYSAPAPPGRPPQHYNKGGSRHGKQTSAVYNDGRRYTDSSSSQKRYAQGRTGQHRDGSGHGGHRRYQKNKSGGQHSNKGGHGGSNRHHQGSSGGHHKKHGGKGGQNRHHHNKSGGQQKNRSGQYHHHKKGGKGNRRRRK